MHRHFLGERRLPDREVAEYVAGVLADFTHVEHLYRIRDARGRALEDVAEMLIEASAAPAGRSTDREREIRRHIGDYTLFFTGLFPDSVATLPRRRPFSADALVDYVKAGKESYAAVAAFDIGAYGRQVRLFRRLSDQFEQCVFALNAVKGDLDRLERGHYRRLQESLGLGD